MNGPNLIRSVSVESIILEISLVFVTIEEEVDAKSVLSVLLEVAGVLGTVVPLVHALTVLQVVAKLAFIPVPNVI